MSGKFTNIEVIAFVVIGWLSGVGVEILQHLIRNIFKNKQ